VLSDWPATLRYIGRLLHLDLRTGAVPLMWFGGILNLIARGLASAQPQAAAVFQGAARGILRPQSNTGQTSTAGVGNQSRPDGFAGRMAQVRRETSELLMESLGETQLRELRAQGETMDRDEASAYALAHVDRYLAALPAEAS
jgi:hypothetical protein